MTTIQTPASYPTVNEIIMLLADMNNEQLKATLQRAQQIVADVTTIDALCAAGIFGR